jgi:Cft2 family RNA processing exonuclease/dsRNA-specific ribonuclease
MSDSSIRITFLGGASSIGASCALVETDAVNILVDCGVRFTPGEALPDLASLEGKRVDAILLTHAHTDHTGALPVVCDAFRGAPVYATPPTIDLVGILLRDALKLMSGPDRDGEIPLYTDEQVARALEAMQPVAFDQPLDVFGTKITFFAASHILGAAMVHIAAPGGNVLFTGDYSVGAQMTVPASIRPPLPADIVVSEATYGSRLHEDRRTAERRLVDQVRHVVEREGRILVPAFAIGRAQEVLRILRRAFARGELDRVAVYVDGMVRAVSAVYARHERYVSRQLAREIRHGTHPLYTDDIRPVEKPADRARVLAERPCIVVASSGMLAGGASTFYAAEFARDERDAILITGYQDEESPGRALLDLASGAAERTLRLGERTVEVKCAVSSYGLSAHADQMQMTAMIEAIDPATVVLVHGDSEAKRALAAALSRRDVCLAEDGQSVVRASQSRKAARSSLPDTIELPHTEDVARARAILGPPRDESLRERDIARSWFGRPTTRAQTGRLISRLEEMGLVRRDDRRRSRVWVNAPDESPLLVEEATLEQRLKVENPKGKLLELCMKLRCGPPATDVSVDGAYHVAEMTLEFPGEVLTSGRARAASRKAAEQLAAAVLLELAEARTRPGDVTPVDETRAADLRSHNPKGRLLEWAAAHKAKAPEFESRPLSGGYAARVTVCRADGTEYSSHWYSARALTTAEQAAADEALPSISPATGATDAPPPDGAQIPSLPANVAPSAPGAAGRDARMVLNEMKQLGMLRDLGFDHHGQSGPSHCPVFTVVGWATDPDGTRHETDAVEGPSKKAAQRLAADRLLATFSTATDAPAQ